MYQCKQCKKKFKRQRDKRQHEFNCSFIMAAKGEPESEWDGSLLPTFDLGCDDGSGLFIRPEYMWGAGDIALTDSQMTKLLRDGYVLV